MLKQPVIITCAITGHRTTRSIAPVPLTPEEQSQSAREAVKDGAAIIHLHVRGDNGEESLDPERYYSLPSDKLDIWARGEWWIVGGEW